MADTLMQGQGIAYFSMEMALEPAMPTYSGGLGALAGDMMRSAADLGLGIVGVTLASRRGYFRQEIRGGEQLEHAEPWEPERFARRVPAVVTVELGGRPVYVTAWQYTVRSCCGGSTARVLLLDTDLPQNAVEDRSLTDTLYGGGEEYRLRQEAVLGVGGVRLLDALGIPVRKYHLNEGHAALLTLELLRRAGSSDAGIAAVQQQCVFTTHTPVPAGHDQFDYAMAMRVLGGLVPQARLRRLGGADRLNMTHLALALSGWVNGVAKRHAQTSRALFPGYEVHAVTNGVHPATWACPEFRALFDAHLPYWCHEPELLIGADRIPLDAVVQAHAGARRRLLAHVAAAVPGAGFDPGRCTIGFARRMTQYKRPHLLFADPARLRAIARRHPLQVVLAGKAHPHDLEGKAQIRQLHAWAAELAPEVPVAFLPDYGMELAGLLVAGVDVWLNTPQRPLEASGTSGMKAALNGVPSLSVLDGWWLEGWAEGETGWAIGEDGPHGSDAADASDLYGKLGGTVLPMFHQQPQAWAAVMRRTIARNASHFNSHRMLRRYMMEAYAR